MAELAGFDVIGEVHLDTIVDLINLQPVTVPAQVGRVGDPGAVDSKSIYLLGGPFSADLNADLGTLGFITVRLVLNVGLEAVVHQSLARLVISLTGSTSVAGRSLSHIGGQATGFVPLSFLPPPSGAPAGPQTPVFLFGVVALQVVLNATTRSQVDAALGQGGADRLTSGLRGALVTLLALAGTKPIQAMAFKVVPGIDSQNPLQLSAMPIVAWIDKTTLGIFGYYRASASGGFVHNKPTGDLTQSHEEFFYDQRGNVSVLPGRRVALLLSSQAFGMVIACPAVRQQVVRSLVEKRDEGAWIKKIRDRDGDALLKEETNARFFGHLVEEFAKDPTLQTVADDIKRAQDDVQADVDAIIRQDAHAEEDGWLDTTPEGQQAITDATPPPCGGGSVQIASQPVPVAQGDLVVTLSRFQIRLDQGHITVHFAADASVKMITERFTATVSGDVDVLMTVTVNGFVGVSLDVKTPVVSVGEAGLVGSLILDLFTKGFWAVVMAYLGLVLQQIFRETLKQAFPDLQPFDPGLPHDPIPTRMVDIQIDPEALVLTGLICRRLRFNDFKPGLVVDATVTRVLTDQPAILGILTFPATEWGCKAARFETVRTFWDTTVSVHGVVSDAPLPITVLRWKIEIGNFSASAIGSAHLIDPAPAWSNEPANIVDGSLTLIGKVNHPDPPIVLIQGPSALGHLTNRDDIPVEVTGDPDRGWQLRFRGSDGNFYVRLSLDVADGDGTQYHGETYVTVQGDQLELSSGYAQYKADCDSKYSQWFRLRLSGMGLAAVGQVQPGEPVMSGETREAIAIQTLVAAGNPAGLRQLAAAMEEFGPGVVRQAGRVSPLALQQRGGQFLR